MGLSGILKEITKNFLCFAFIFLSSSSLCAVDSLPTIVAKEYVRNLSPYAFRELKDFRRILEKKYIFPLKHNWLWSQLGPFCFNGEAILAARHLIETLSEEPASQRFIEKISTINALFNRLREYSSQVQDVISTLQEQRIVSNVNDTCLLPQAITDTQQAALDLIHNIFDILYALEQEAENRIVRQILSIQIMYWKLLEKMLTAQAHFAIQETFIMHENGEQEKSYTNDLVYIEGITLQEVDQFFKIFEETINLSFINIFQYINFFFHSIPLEHQEKLLQIPFHEVAADFKHLTTDILRHSAPYSWGFHKSIQENNHIRHHPLLKKFNVNPSAENPYKYEGALWHLGFLKDHKKEEYCALLKLIELKPDHFSDLLNLLHTKNHLDLFSFCSNLPRKKILLLIKTIATTAVNALNSKIKTEEERRSQKNKLKNSSDKIFYPKECPSWAPVEPCQGTSENYNKHLPITLEDPYNFLGRYNADGESEKKASWLEKIRHAFCCRRRRAPNPIYQDLIHPIKPTQEQHLAQVIQYLEGQPNYQLPVHDSIQMEHIRQDLNYNNYGYQPNVEHNSLNDECEQKEKILKDAALKKLSCNDQMNY